ncbi:MAG: hypothetical protein WD045_04495, partial [Pirellulaceae bacterium]
NRLWQLACRGLKTGARATLAEAQTAQFAEKKRPRPQEKDARRGSPQAAACGSAEIKLIS